LQSALINQIHQASASRRKVVFHLGGRTVETSWSWMGDEAIRVAGSLQALGIGPASRVALVGSNSPDLVIALLGVWLAGATACILPPPRRRSADQDDGLYVRLGTLKPAAVLVDPALGVDLGELPPPALDFATLRAAKAPAYEEPSLPQDLAAYVQFTSGSTSTSRAAVIPVAGLARHVAAIWDFTFAGHVEQAEFGFVSWCPLYHDMGLICGLVIPLFNDLDMTLAAPEEFIASPGQWFGWIERAEGLVASLAPNFAYGMGARILRRGPQRDLARWRYAIDGGECINPDTVQTFLEAAGRHGFDPMGYQPAYGLAEVVLAVATPAPGTGLRTDRVGRRPLEAELVANPATLDDNAPTRTFVVLGEPLPGTDLRIVPPGGLEELAERHVGEVLVKSPDLMTSYLDDEERTAAVLHGGWLRTGDLGYVTEGQLVVCGRVKDVIVIRGVNVFPEDIERAAAKVSGVRPAGIMAFAINRLGGDGRERFAVVAEIGEASDRARVRREIEHAVYAAVGASPSEIVLAAPGAVPKTSSGKLQRQLGRRLYESRSFVVH
jgi:fatty-acyl-CoA synthase